MDYEKAYKEALERAKEKRDEYERLDGEKSFVPSDIEYIFPELRENKDELMRKEAIAIIKQYNIICEREGDKCYTADKVISWLEKQGEQKPTWSEEDSKNLNSVKWIIENSENLNRVFETIDSPKYIKKYFIDWLKSLKDRFQLQPKQEWSEKDEKVMKRIDSLLYSQCTIHGSEYEELHNWLKSIKPHWKPSEEQMNALDKAKNNTANYHDIRLGLQSLYNDLLKL